jgi:hypothetical protein
VKGKNMGGIGSGSQNKNISARPVVEDFLSIDILDFNKQDLLDSGTAFKITYSNNKCGIGPVAIYVDEKSLFLKYNINQTKRSQEVHLTRTTCNYGGSRTWLLCSECNSKRTALYLGSYGYWACRECLRLAYAVQKLNSHERHAYMAQKIKRQKLNIIPGSCSSPSERPFRMSKKKHIKILGQVLKHEQLSHFYFTSWFQGVIEKSNGID